MGDKEHFYVILVPLFMLKGGRKYARWANEQ
jgi:hypothetical protein